MGRSSVSCFHIITCGSDAVDKDNVGASESKSSSDKRGWSFRKRSASTRNRVLSNNVLSEVSSSFNKESSETATSNLPSEPNTAFPGKTSAMSWTDETPQLSTSVKLKLSETIVATKDDTLHDVNPDESVIIVIQATIRKFLAQREMLKLKNVVKLQAAIRGHLVRRQAVGTLRCVQAIVKMQALVRARLARLSSEESCVEGELNRNYVKDGHSLKFLEKGDSLAKPNVKYTSIDKLLKNKFAHQLLESSPSTKHIHIKCVPSRSDSAWNWLERWMSVSSTRAEQPQKPESRMEQQGQDKVECTASQMETGFPSEDCESADLKANIKKTVVPSKSEENLVIYDVGNFDFQALEPTPSSKSDNLEPPKPENSGTLNSKDCSLDLVPNQTEESNSIAQMTSKPEMEGEQSTHTVKRFSLEQVDIEEKKFVFETRKATNPPFAAVQSKFEELSSTAHSARSTGQVIGVDLNSDVISPAMDIEIRTKEIDLAENSVLHTSRVKVGGSDYGTELSISSTLDSPDRSEIGRMDVDQEAKPHEEEETSYPDSIRSLDINNVTTYPGLDLSNSITVVPEELDGVNGANSEPDISITAVDSSKESQKSETNVSNVQIELESQTDHQMYKSSPEASPISHMTVPESQGTPSSLVSMKVERTKSDRGASNKKCRSLGGRSPSNLNHDPGASSSVEKLPKENKTGKRRISFGSGRPDYADQKPIDGNASNILPKYMQATESARAKALAISSPKSSPDVQDNDIYVKKKHSLAGANGKQGSPRIERSTSQSKGNGHINERKWLR